MVNFIVLTFYGPPKNHWFFGGPIGWCNTYFICFICFVKTYKGNNAFVEENGVTSYRDTFLCEKNPWQNVVQNQNPNQVLFVFFFGFLFGRLISIQLTSGLLVNSRLCCLQTRLLTGEASIKPESACLITSMVVIDIFLVHKISQTWQRLYVHADWLADRRCKHQAWEPLPNHG